MTKKKPKIEEKTGDEENEPKERPTAAKDNYWRALCGKRSPHSEPNMPSAQSHSTDHECRNGVGIYGWRKKFLYILIVLIAALVVLNACLTLWIISLLDFSMNGLANMRIESDGLTLNGNAFIDDHLFATTISSRQGQSLKLISDNNITITAGSHTDGHTLANGISIGSSRITAIANDFLVRGRDGRLLFGVDHQKVTIAADTLQVENLSGLRFSRSLQTPLIQSIGYSDLKLVAPERRVAIRGPKSVALESRLGDISAISLGELRLRSKLGKITLESADIVLRQVVKADSSSTTSEAEGTTHALPSSVYQLCVCADSGKIFTAPPDKPCAANETICGPKHAFGEQLSRDHT